MNPRLKKHHTHRLFKKGRKYKVTYQRSDKNELTAVMTCLDIQQFTSRWDAKPAGHVHELVNERIKSAMRVKDSRPHTKWIRTGR